MTAWTKIICIRYCKWKVNGNMGAGSGGRRSEVRGQRKRRRTMEEGRWAKKRTSPTMPLPFHPSSERSDLPSSTGFSAVQIAVGIRNRIKIFCDNLCQFRCSFKLNFSHRGLNFTAYYTCDSVDATLEEDFMHLY